MISTQKKTHDDEAFVKMEAQGEPTNTPPVGANELSLPYGIIGMPDLTKVELLYSEEELPFIRMRQVTKDRESVEFFAVEPSHIVPDYEIEMSKEDMLLLDIKSPQDVYLLNVITIRDNGEVSANLVAPIVFNKRTGKGKQIIVNNFKEYSARHVLHKSDTNE